MRETRQVESLLDELLRGGQVTAAAVIAQSGSECLVEAYAGWLDPASRATPVGAGTLFDLASLTKPLTATLAWTLHDSGDLAMESSLGSLWHSSSPTLERIRLEDLLAHRAGLRRWMPLYEECADPGEVTSRLLEGHWIDAPSGTYSDLDYMLWTLSAERTLGASYRRLLGECVLTRLGEAEFSFPGEGKEVARCLLPTGREVELAAEMGLVIRELPPPAPGEPQDGNSRFLGRALGHAGVFATATGVAALARAYGEPGGLLSAGASRRAVGGSGRYAVGWFRQPETRGGRALGPSAFGHEGFTGCSAWIDPGADVSIVLLAHRASLEVDLGEARARLHRCVLSI